MGVDHASFGYLMRDESVFTKANYHVEYDRRSPETSFSFCINSRCFCYLINSNLGHNFMYMEISLKTGQLALIIYSANHIKGINI